MALLGDPLSVSAGAVASTEGTADFGIRFTDALADTDFAAYGFQDDVHVYDDVLTLGQLEEVRLDNLVTMPLLRAGDANQDRSFDQLDIISALNAAIYLTGPYAANRREDVSQIGLAGAFLPSDLPIVGPLADGRTPGDVGLMYAPVPEPSSMAILAIGFGIAFACFRPRMYSGNWSSISLPLST